MVKIAVYEILLFILGGTAVYGLDIIMIPVIYYEKQGTGYVQKTYRRDITADITSILNKYYNIQVSKTPLNDRLAGVTDLDARRASEYYHVDDVLYGTIKDDGSSLQAELKIYNRRREDYGLFYASDTNNQYERLIKGVSEHIMEWYKTDRDKVDALNHAIQDLQTEIASIKEELENREKTRSEARKKVKDEVEKEFTLRLPVNAGYWSYIDRLWVESVQGTVEMVVGLDMFPEMQFPALYDMKNEASFGLNIGYRNGVTRNKGAVLMNGIFINPEIKYHLNFYTKNWICIGCGLFYENDTWSIEDREYQRNINSSQSLTGYSVSLDYAYRINRLFTVNIGTNLYGYFVEGSSPVVRSYLGTVITLIGGKNEK
jgi:gas vesicle protein